MASPFLPSTIANDVSRVLYLRNDPYEIFDAVFGVKQSLIVDFSTINAEIAKKYGVKEGGKVLKYDLVLVDEKETERLRNENALKALKKVGTEGQASESFAYTRS
jgi:hypothetical protein